MAAGYASYKYAKKKGIKGWKRTALVAGCAVGGAAAGALIGPKVARVAKKAVRVVKKKPTRVYQKVVRKASKAKTKITKVKTKVRSTYQKAKCKVKTKVTRTVWNETDTLVQITINGEILESTETHPFWVKETGFVPAYALEKGALLRLSDGSNVSVEDVEIQHLDEPVKVYNFTVEDNHTYYVGDSGVWVHNAKCGKTFEITDWTDYPDNIEKPEGPFKILEGKEYDTARKAANRANASLHRKNPQYKGKQIHEVHPVKFGGSPTDLKNKIVLDPKVHSKLTIFWKRLLRMKKGKK